MFYSLFINQSCIIYTLNSDGIRTSYLRDPHDHRAIVLPIELLSYNFEMIDFLSIIVFLVSVGVIGWKSIFFFVERIVYFNYFQCTIYSVYHFMFKGNMGATAWRYLFKSAMQAFRHPAPHTLGVYLLCV